MDVAPGNAHKQVAMAKEGVARYQLGAQSRACAGAHEGAVVRQAWAGLEALRPRRAPTVSLLGFAQEPEEKVWPINTEESRADWNALGSGGLLVHGMWLVGAAWNINKKELEEPSSQELIQQLPLLSMIPTPTVQTGSYTMRGAPSLCTTARSQPSLHRQSSTTLTESEGPGEAAEGPEPPASDRPSSGDHPSTEAQQTRFSDEFQNIKDSTSLDLHLGEETLPSSRSDVLSTARSRYYECPVYEGGPSGSANQMPVLNITLPAGAKGGNHWVQRRVAIYLSRY
ncbi:hypothetical protein C7M84_025092 [Penaeus vannamei]|uniref:Dynein heavy chain C-terminal domain-containing protein n=1 Tax=Penaeus vannamei TaxID=6689 RepID=A0A423TZ50_PENVA|nr:hypothetical protein C7M84_025092 [Penaeus vannamei]